MQVGFTLLGNDMVATVDLDVTSRGSPPNNYDDPGEGAEFTVKLLELRHDLPVENEGDNPPLEVTAWLRDMIEASLQENDECIDAANEPPEDRDPDEARDAQYNSVMQGRGYPNPDDISDL